jgi:hypothetical protein
MNFYKLSKTLLLAIAFPCALPLSAQQQPETKLSDNAALRYWSAFAQMRDASLTEDQAKELQRILQGTAPYDDLKYRDLAARNRLAVETLQRGSAINNCDWGIEYQLASNAPIEYVPKALALGRINILFSMHQLQTGDRIGGIRTLSAGIRFSHDLATGGPLMAALAGKTLLVAHLRMVAFAAVEKALSPAENAMVLAALGRIGTEGVDWQAAIRREFELISMSGFSVPVELQEQYRRTLQDAAQLPTLQRAIASLPKPVASKIINPERVLDQKRELDEQLQAARLRPR